MRLSVTFRVTTLVAVVALVATLPAMASSKRPRLGPGEYGQEYYVTCDPPGIEVMFKIQDDLGPEHACIRVFTTSGTWTSPKDIRSNGNQILVVAGGGGGGMGAATSPGGGGGAGGNYTCGPQLLQGNTTYDITVGLGGAGGTVDSAGGRGGDSSFPGTSALGGGGGGGAPSSATNGGGGGSAPVPSGSSSTGPGQGQSGGSAGGGGGGSRYGQVAASQGLPSGTGAGASGIDGKYCISILSDYISPLLSGGGGGYAAAGGGTASHGGGAGGSSGTAGADAAANTGGGGGGGRGTDAAGHGADGLVVIVYGGYRRDPASTTPTQQPVTTKPGSGSGGGAGAAAGGGVRTSPITALPRVSSPQIPAGGTFTTTLTARNTGTATATKTRIVFPAPSGFTIVRARGAKITNGRVATWNVGTLKARATLHREVTLRASADAIGRKRIRFSVLSSLGITRSTAASVWITGPGAVTG